MEYVSTTIPDSISVKGIYTAISPDLSRDPGNKGEAHDFPEIFFLKRGAHSIAIDDESFKLKSGQVLIYAPGSRHRSLTASDSEALIISFDVIGDSIKDIYNRKITLTGEQERLLTELICDAIKCFEGRGPSAKVGGMVLKSGVDDYTLQKIKNQLEFFLINVHKSYADAEKSKREKRWDEEINAVIELMRKSTAENLSLSEIADRTSMSVSKLKLLFREKKKCGPINYFIEIKIEKAKELIKEGKLNFTEISECLGFNSLHYFSRLFKKITGISPSEYARGV